MGDALQEYVNSRGVDVRVDRAGAVIRQVKILGLESRNGRTYSPAALAAAAGLYEGTKVNVNHPQGAPHAPRDYRDRIGVMRRVALREGEGLFGDLHFNPKHDLAEQLMWDAEHAPENVGFSHNVQARTSRQGERWVVEEILHVESVDLVADPATTRGLFESDAAGDSVGSLEELLRQVTLEQLRAARPDLVQAMESEQRSELERLREEVDQWRAREASAVRSGVIDRLLVEYGLPRRDTGDEAGHAVVSDEFLERLEREPSEGRLRELVEQRARWMQRMAWEAERWSAGRPRSREQRSTDGTQREWQPDAAAFARAIR